jgi:hypothetical protein
MTHPRKPFELSLDAKAHASYGQWDRANRQIADALTEAKRETCLTILQRLDLAADGRITLTGAMVRRVIEQVFKET